MKDTDGSETVTGMPPLVSVVMPCFNAAPFVREAVDSVLSQRHPNVELIVVDDGSTDASRDILRSYGKRLTLLEQSNRGPYPARNLGLGHVRGEFVAFLDADDWWAPDFIDRLCAPLLTAPDAALAYCGWRNVGLAGPRGEPYVPPDYEADSKTARFLRAAAPWPIHAALTRKSVLDEVGGFDTDLPTCMDYDLWLRIAMTRPIVRVPEVLAFYRHHDVGQITTAQWRQAENSWRVKRKFLREHPQFAAGLSADELRELIDGGLLRRGYDNYWQRDLVSARRIFRFALRVGAWRLTDLRYLLPALLPEALYLALIAQADRARPPAPD